MTAPIEMPFYGLNDATIDQLVGVTLRSAVIVTDDEGQQLHFEAIDGRTFVFGHRQSCCERVWIEDVCGDLKDLVGAPLAQARELKSEGPRDEGIEYGIIDGHMTWTFYDFRTSKGSVTIRWRGESNGFYSESVDLVCIAPSAIGAAKESQ